MIEIKTKLRKWGNSFGVMVPQGAIAGEDVKEGDEVTIFLKKNKTDLKRMFGKLKKWRINAQKFKDERREEDAKRDRLLS
ncbi:hypothetical protein J4456_02905 [Candidatus Pacearchaeota archaeon]|nr:hypothetical protein [Candidatus Pacearchaeota archaeon]